MRERGTTTPRTMEAWHHPAFGPDATPGGRGIVAMSGGVDSSVAAAALHASGADVVGVSMRLYASAASGRSCCSPDDLLDARSVAAQCGFPFYVANYQAEFEERVIRYFVEEYARGRTPSPCVACNDHLKFDVLLDRMFALDGSWLATGHYARVVERDGRYALLRGVDRTRDQSYFLFGLKRDRLQYIRFPLGGLTKVEVRAIAEQLAVPTATKPESQDICFVGGRTYSEFVAERLAESSRRPGTIVRVGDGATLGTHGGIHQFTVGQRRGLGVAYPEPLYVRSIDPDTGTVRVGTREEIVDGAFSVERANWLRWQTPPASFDCSVQIRYRHAPVACRVEVSPNDAGRARVMLGAPEHAVSPGQAAVFYDGDEVLGGGWIDDVG